MLSLAARLPLMDPPHDAPSLREALIEFGVLPVLGFRIGPFAYLTDCNSIPDASFALLEGVKVVVIDALRERPHPTHFTVDEALAAVSRMGAERAYLTHITRDLSHAATSARWGATCIQRR